MRPDGSKLQQLTHDKRVNWFPHCSPDGQRVAYLIHLPSTEGFPPDRAVESHITDPDGE
jgi:Tol biopolymer transport system component